MGRQAPNFSLLHSTPSLPFHIVGRRQSAGGDLVLSKFEMCGVGGGGYDKWTHPPHDRLLANVQGSLDPLITIE